MTDADKPVEAEVVDTAIPVPQTWRPTALATIGESDFQERVRLMRLERERLAEIQRGVMASGIDYGKVPGTDKPTLLKPGAETLNKMCGLTPTFSLEYIGRGDQEKAPAVDYVVKCELHERDASGPVVVHGLGSCNSWERKYRYRQTERTCPKCGNATIIKGKAEYGGGWLCWAKRGGCGEKFDDRAPEILDQEVGRAENPDPKDLDNTILKMAKKRSFVDATLTYHAASGLFTQDVGDDDEAAAKSTPTAPPQQPRQQRTGPGPRREPSKFISEAQRRKLFATAGERAGELDAEGYGEQIVRAVLATRDIESTKNIPRKGFDKILTEVMEWRLPEPPSEAEGPQDDPFEKEPA